MARVKTSKQEFKRQRDALARFERYLPTLLLKKQQLQLELRQVEIDMSKLADAETQLRRKLADWIKLFAEPQPFSQYLKLEAVHYGEQNIAGVAVPTLEQVAWQETVPDLHLTPSWLEEALESLKAALTLQLRRRVLNQQHHLLSAELRVTTQRVNLFEKVKIPEARDNIRIIRIALGDLQAAGVVRAKIAKAKTVEERTA